MEKCLFVGLGGFLGSVFRYLLSVSFASDGFPLTTMCINFAGAVLIGLVSELASGAAPPHPNLTLFLTVGVCGGFTTFSTFSMETVGLIQRGRLFLGAGYAALSVVLCLAGVFMGRLIIRAAVA